MSRPMYRHPGPAAAHLTLTAPDEQEPADEMATVRWLSQMRADLAETLGGIMLRGARPVPITVLPTQLSASPGRLVGWSLHETTGANPALLHFYNGDNTGADLIATAVITQGGENLKWLPPGISFTEGLYVSLMTGGGLSNSVEGTIYMGAAD